MKHMVRGFVCLAFAAGVSLAASATDFITGTTDDPLATETALEAGVTYCLVFKNAEQAWTFTPSFKLRVDKLLVVGGGGSGGCDCGAGGGGGAVLYTNYTELAEAERPILDVGTTLTVQIGAGGVPAVKNNQSGKKGGTSVVALDGVTFRAFGGGGGAHWGGAGLTVNNGEIASGGGNANNRFPDYIKDAYLNEGVGAYNSLYGHHGGSYNGAENAGGGGGAGGDGQDGVSGTGGKGGIGVSNDITGEPHLYGSGGCAGRNNPQAPYEGGGSRAAGYSINGTDGLGGGGSGSFNSGSASGAGGCGTIILVVTDAGTEIRGVSVRDAYSVFDGQTHAAQLVNCPPFATAKWAYAEEGPFDLDEAPGFADIGVHECWCQLTAEGRTTLVLKGAVYIRGTEPEPLSIGVANDPGVVQYAFGGDKYVIGFTNAALSSVNFSPIENLRIEQVLLVGGGGSGGWNCGGGGGGGGVVWKDYTALPEEERPLVTGLFNVKVGAGGEPAGSITTRNPGFPSTLSLPDAEPLSAWGGGAGGNYKNPPSSASVLGEVGSGGGVGNGGKGDREVENLGYNPLQGRMGGMNNGEVAAGGGGAGAPGGNAAGTVAGRGGDGFACDITGETHLYGSGGCGGQGTTCPEPPEGGGAGGLKSDYTTVSGGVDGLGGGGGGTRSDMGGCGSSGAGGSGCVYLKVSVIAGGGTSINAAMNDYWGVADGEAHVSELQVFTQGVTVRWSLAGAEGPFNLVGQPSFTEPGVYTNWCELTAAGKDTLVLQGVVGLRLATGDYYVAVNGNDKAGLGTVECPYATVGKALANVLDGNAVRIGPGTYAERGLVLNRAVELVGDETDPSRVVLDGSGLGRVLEMSDAGARVSGLTMAAGFSAGGGGCVSMSAGVISNCVITGGNVANGSGGNVRMTGGQIVDSQVLNGTAHLGGGAVVQGTGRLVRCLVSGNNGGDSGGGVAISGEGVVENSLIKSNTATWGADVQVNSSTAWLINCTVVVKSGSDRPTVFLETNGGNVFNSVMFGLVRTKKGELAYCACDREPQLYDQTSTTSLHDNIIVDASIFEDTTNYCPKKRSVLRGKGAPQEYAAHAVSPVDYAGNRRLYRNHIDIGHFQFPPPGGMVIMVK